MVSVAALVPVVLALALGADAAPSNRQSWGRQARREVETRATITRAAGDFQTFNQGVNAIYAPAVTNNNGLFYTNSLPYFNIYDALIASCNAQSTACALSLGWFDHSVCWGSQALACTGNAQTAASAYSSQANIYSTSVASANYAKATTTRTVSGDFQTFTGSLGNIAAPPVTAGLVSGTYTQSALPYFNLKDALYASCATQATLCSTAATAGGNKYELTVTNCQGSQLTACEANAQIVLNNQAGSASASASQHSYSISSSSVASANAYSSASAYSYSSSSSAAAARSTSSAAPAATPSSAASISASVAVSTSAAPSSSSNPIPVVVGNLQTFSGVIGGTAPAVVQTGTQFTQSNIAYPSLLTALQQSCYAQANLCAASTIIDKTPCFGVQLNACLAEATTVSSAFSLTASIHLASSSVAASPAAASSSASPTFDAASASTFSHSSSASAYSASVKAQQDAQSAAAYSASSSAAAYSAGQSAAAYSADQSAAAYSTSAAAYSASTSAAAYSASTSAAAYSASSSEAAHSASLSAYSSSSSAAAAKPTVAIVPDGWKMASTACIAEGQTGRALTGASFTANDMTWAKCTQYCADRQFALAGLEYSSECYCGNNLANGASLNNPSNQCTMFASGSQDSEQGGGPNALTLFVSTKDDLNPNLSADYSTINTPIPDGWQSLTSGANICIKEGTSGRALAAAMTASDDMTIGKCIDFCNSKGMQYAGLEYSRECFCGNDLVNGASKDKTDTCSMQCAGAAGTICGGPGLLTVYQNTKNVYTATTVGSYSKQGCMQEVQGRALTGATLFSDSMTLETCTAFCQQGGFDFAGLEYASECYCGNSLSNGASFSAFSTQCNMPCSGNSGQNCGGPNAIALYSTKHGMELIGA